MTLIRVLDHVCHPAHLRYAGEALRHAAPDRLTNNYVIEETS